MKCNFFYVFYWANSFYFIFPFAAFQGNYIFLTHDSVSSKILYLGLSTYRFDNYNGSFPSNHSDNVVQWITILSDQVRDHYRGTSACP